MRSAAPSPSATAAPPRRSCAAARWTPRPATRRWWPASTPCSTAPDGSSCPPTTPRPSACATASPWNWRATTSPYARTTANLRTERRGRPELPQRTLMPRAPVPARRSATDPKGVRSRSHAPEDSSFGASSPRPAAGPGPGLRARRRSARPQEPERLGRVYGPHRQPGLPDGPGPDLPPDPVQLGPRPVLGGQLLHARTELRHRGGDQRAQGVRAGQPRLGPPAPARGQHPGPGRPGHRARHDGGGRLLVHGLEQFTGGDGHVERVVEPVLVRLGQPYRAHRQHLEGGRPTEDGQRRAGRLEAHRGRTVVVEQPGEEGREIRGLPLVGEVEHRHAATASSLASVYSWRNSRSSAVSRRGRCASKSNGTITVEAWT